LADGVQEGAAACDDCATPLVGRFCHACGEDNAPPRREFRALAADFADTIFSFTEHVLPTLRDLAIDPGRILRGLRDGDTKRYLSPVKLYVSATVVFFLFLSIFSVALFQLRVERTGPGAPVVLMKGDAVDGDNFRLIETWLHPRTVAARDGEVVAAFDRFLARPDIDETTRSYVLLVRNLSDEPTGTNDLIATWAPRVLWLLMPLYALLLWPLYRRGTLVADHVIFALWAHTSLFLLLIVGALWNMTGLAGGLGVAMALYQAYLTVGLKGYYGRSWAGAVTKGAIHTGVYGLIWLLLTAGFFFWQAMQHLPPSFWE